MAIRLEHDQGTFRPAECWQKPIQLEQGLKVVRTSTNHPMAEKIIAKKNNSDRNSPSRKIERAFGSLARKSSSIIGSSYAFVTAVLIVIIWALTGPMFNYSQNWQLVINTGTTIITFLMVFLLQHTQNKDSLALQLKLDELIGALEGANNKMIEIEEMDEEDLLQMKQRYKKVLDAIDDATESRGSISVHDDDDE